MKDFQNLELTALIDLLSEYTIKYSKLHADGGDKDEFDDTRKKIELLQAEITARKKTGRQQKDIG